MTRDRAELRRYLLGQANDDESAAIEREFIRDDTSLESMLDGESGLIEDYLDDRLSRAERLQFDRHYLASPDHRRRVDVIRRLSDRESTSMPAHVPAGRSWRAWMPDLAVAALLAIAVTAAVRFSIRSRPAAPNIAVATAPPSGSPAATSPAPALQRVIAVSLAPGIVRSGGDTATIVIESGIDVVALQLEGDADVKAPAHPAAAIRTVLGTEVYRGPAATDRLPPGVIARLDVPATRLVPDDYVISLVDVAANGAEQEQARYLLRVRAR